MPFDTILSEKYINSLCKELILIKQNIKTLKSIYIGGGTPTVLSKENLFRLFKALKDNFIFSSDIEITIEINPGTVYESKIQTLIDFGVNRFSIGVQSFNNEELKFLGRIHNNEDVNRTFKILQKYKIENFSIDLMYAIPGQTIQSWKSSLEKAISICPLHISTYELTIEKNTHLYKLLEDSPYQITMPDEDTIIDMYNHAIDYLTKHGFEHYEISNFTKPSYRCIHNLNYWNRGEYIGAGAGAHSFINNKRTSNITDVIKYINSIESNVMPVEQSNVISPHEALKEFIFLGLRKIEGINIKKLIALSTTNERLVINSIEDLIHKGFLEINNDFLRLTRKGILISNTIIANLFEKLGL